MDTVFVLFKVVDLTLFGYETFASSANVKMVARGDNLISSLKDNRIQIEMCSNPCWFMILLWIILPHMLGILLPDDVTVQVF